MLSVVPGEGVWRAPLTALGALAFTMAHCQTTTECYFYFVTLLFFCKSKTFLWISFLKKRLYLFIFIGKGREIERKGEEHQCVVASWMHPGKNLAHNPGMCPDWESNQWPFGLQVGAQSTEPHQPRILHTISMCYKCSLLAVL